MPSVKTAHSSAGALSARVGVMMGGAERVPEGSFGGVASSTEFQGKIS